MTAQDIITHLNLQQHPEGGWFKETWRADNPGRATGTCIYFLLAEGDFSHWHKVDATEIWLYHSGAPLILSLSKTKDGPAKEHTLTPDLHKGAPQIIVPKGRWQAARSSGEYTLVSCTVSRALNLMGSNLRNPASIFQESNHMDHRALVATIPPEVKGKLQQRSDMAGLKHLAIYFGTLAAISSGIVLQIPFWPLLILPQGLLLVFLFTLSHECTHKTPFKTGWINEAVGHLVSIPICLPFTWFRYFHLAHHKWTNHPTKDPELDGKPRPDNWRSLAVYLSGWSYWAGMTRVLANNARGKIEAPYLPARQHRAIRTEARILFVFYTMAGLSLLFTPLIFWLWLLPVVIGQPFLRLYLLAEHGLCPAVANMLENSRTTFTNRLVRFLAWNMPYHAEHHAFPNVPFHQLPSFHRWTQTHLKSTSDGYAEFTTDYARALRR